MVAYLILQQNIFKRQKILELLVLGLSRTFNKNEFSIDRCFQKCFIFVKAVWDY